MPNKEIKAATGVVIDSSPDERGNVMAAATVNGRLIALTMNAN